MKSCPFSSRIEASALPNFPAPMIVVFMIYIIIHRFICCKVYVLIFGRVIFYENFVIIIWKTISNFVRKGDRMIKVYYGSADESNSHDYSWGMLQKILEKDYGIKFKNEDIVYNEHKKPFLKGNPVYFNISRCEKVCVVAVGDNEMGVDVEHKEKMRYNLNDDIYKTWLNEKDQKSFDRADDKLGFLTQKWTEKEAVLKMIGSGILNVHSIKNAFKHDDYVVSSFWIGNYCLSVTNKKSERLKIKNLIHFSL